MHLPYEHITVPMSGEYHQGLHIHTKSIRSLVVNQGEKMFSKKPMSRNWRIWKEGDGGDNCEPSSNSKACGVH